MSDSVLLATLGLSIGDVLTQIKEYQKISNLMEERKLQEEANLVESYRILEEDKLKQSNKKISLMMLKKYKR